MKLKMIVLMSVSALMMSACAHKHHKHDCACAKAEGKKECADGECSMEKKKCCADDKKEAEKSTP